MDILIRQLAINFLNTLINQPLLYALKSPDTELYDFGLGELVEAVNWRGTRKEVGSLILHVLCRFKVIWKNEKHQTDKYYEDTPCEKFHSAVQHLVGQTVKRVALSEKNDLWLDFGDYWIVFATFENGKEAWRFFTTDKTQPHLVASNSWLEFIY